MKAPIENPKEGDTYINAKIEVNYLPGDKQIEAKMQEIVRILDEIDVIQKARKKDG